MTDHSDLIAKLRACATARTGENPYQMLSQAADALSSQSLSLSEAREEIERLKGLLHATGKPRFNEAMRRLEAAEAERDRLKAALDYLAENTSRSLAFDGKWDCEDDNSDLWIITEVQGGINDREWVLIGSGKTPAEALLDAAPALENSKAGLADANTNSPLSDLSSLRKGAEVAVKPLVWDLSGMARGYPAKAVSIFGNYTAWEIEDGFWMPPEAHCGRRAGVGLQSALDAAQSDFETRIRSALVSGGREDGDG